MRYCFFAIVYFITLSSYSQSNQDSYIEFATKDKEVVLYKDYRYHVADTLKRLERMYEIYLMKIDSCVPNFCRVKGYTTVPYLKDRQQSTRTYWIENENLESALSNSFSIYKSPFITTSENLKLKIEDYSDIYFKVTIEAVNKDWVKVKLKINDQDLVGWVNSNSLCPLKHEGCE